MRRLILAISGASGMPLAATLLRALVAAKDIEVHLMVSQAAELVMRHEHDAQTPQAQAPQANASQAQISHPHEISAVLDLAHTRHDVTDFSAGPASGSWRHDGMIVCPCSMSSLAAIATGLGTNLIHRAADVTLKERRPLVLVTRETPLSRIHLRNMLAAAEAGAVIMPPCPAFYTQPLAVQDILDHTAGRILDQVGIPHSLTKRWRDG